MRLTLNTRMVWFSAEASAAPAAAWPRWRGHRQASSPCAERCRQGRKASRRSGGGRELHGRMKRVSGVELTLRASFLSKATFAFIFWDNAMSATPSLAAHWLSDARPFVWAERTSIVDFSACKNKHDLMSAQRKMLKAAISIVKKVELTLR